MRVAEMDTPRWSSHPVAAYHVGGIFDTYIIVAYTDGVLPFSFATAHFDRIRETTFVVGCNLSTAVEYACFATVESRSQVNARVCSPSISEVYRMTE